LKVCGSFNGEGDGGGLCGLPLLFLGITASAVITAFLINSGRSLSGRLYAYTAAPVIGPVSPEYGKLPPETGLTD